MKKALALSMTALLLLAGCLGTDDLEEAVDEVVSIAGCSDEGALNYVENATDNNTELCAFEDDIVGAIVDFITLMDEGPDMETLDETIGYSMEISEVVDGTTEHFMEVALMSPTGMKSTITDTYGDDHRVEEIIFVGNEMQFSNNPDEEDGYTVRMTHAGDFDDVMSYLMDSEDSGDGDNIYDNCEDGYGLSSYDCWNNDWDEDGDGVPEDSNSYWNYECEQLTDGSWECSTDHVNYYDNCEYEDQNYYECWLDEWDTDNDGSYDLGSDGYSDDECEQLTDGSWACGQSESDDGMDDDDEDPESTDYTDSIDWLQVEFTGWAPDETGITFSAVMNYEGAMFGLLEIHTTEDFEVMGFTMLDPDEEDNWVEFMMLDDGDISTDSTIALSALPFLVLDASMFSDDDDDYDDDDYSGVYWIEWTHCEWEGDSTGDDMRWWCTDNDDGSQGYDDWWYYCEYDQEDDLWYCTDDFGQDENYEYSATETQRDEGAEGRNEGNNSDHADSFAYMDANGDGLVTLSEWADMVNQSEGPMNESDYAGLEYMFAVYDEDGNEGLNFTEFENLMNSANNDQSGPDYEVIFNSMDTDGDGFITLWDWTDMINETDGEMNESDLNNFAFMFDMYDEDDSGTLNFTEFEAWMIDSNNPDSEPDYEIMFNMMDEDGDGLLTLSEWSNWINETDGEMNESDMEGFEYMFAMYDEDGNEGLNFTEFEYMMENMENETECVDVMAGEVAPTDGHFTYASNGTTVLVEEGAVAPEDGEFCWEVYDEEFDTEQIFDSLDLNGDGLVTKSEWSDAGNESGDPMDEDDWEGFSTIFDLSDEDGDGGLNYSEFLEMWDLVTYGSDDNPNLAFAMMDSNGDGELTSNEWTDFAEDEGENTEGLEMVVHLYDLDNSGGLDIYEFMGVFYGGEENAMDYLPAFMIYSFLEFAHGDFDDYSLTLADCDYEDESWVPSNCNNVMTIELGFMLQEDGNMPAGMYYMDSDESGTISSGDMIMFNPDITPMEWNSVRLYSESADAYSDENPMLPGFTGIIATISLLGAALIRRD